MALFDIERVDQYLNTKYLGRHIIYNQLTKTTMDDAEVGAREKGDANGTVYIADRQTGARGTKGHTWKAESSGNLYFTFILYRDLVQDVDPYMDRSVEYCMDISAAVATLQALVEFGLQEAKIKWLNDIWVRGHKLCGALTEYKGRIQCQSGNEQHLYILGIGVNVNCDMRSDPSMYQIATSTLNETGYSLCREEVFAAICNRLEPLLETSRSVICDLYNQHAVFKSGDLVTVIWSDSGKQKVCEFVNVAEDWSVNVKDVSSGEIYNVSHTNVSVRPRPVNDVCVLSGPSLESWSYDQTMQTCFALIDTSQYNVKSLSLEQLKEGIPSSCRVIVVCELKLPVVDDAVIPVLQDYVKQGGKCLCIGNGHQLFQIQNNSGQMTDKAEAGVVKLSIKQDSGSVYMCSMHASISLHDTLEIQHVLATRQPSDIVEEDKTPEVFIGRYGTGKLAVCLPNIELSFANCEDKFPALKDRVSDLKSTSFKKDCLFKSILNYLEV